MQVACPNCEARYLVDPEAIGPTGRTVQCSRCSHRWYESSDQPFAPFISTEIAPQERPVTDFDIRPQIYDGGLPAIPARPREFPRWAKVVIGIAVLIVLFGGVASGFKDDLAPLLPPDLRQALGLEVQPPPSPAPVAPQQLTRATDPMPTLVPAPAAATPAEPGAIILMVDVGASRIEFTNGRYAIHGEIVNKGKAEASIHALKLLFKKGTAVLGERFYPLFAGPIQPSARLPFNQVLDNPPPAGTTDIVPTIE
jgi:predicted Zn finger-like uncharacterized protein